MALKPHHVAITSVTPCASPTAVAPLVDATSGRVDVRLKLVDGICTSPIVSMKALSRNATLWKALEQYRR